MTFRNAPSLSQGRSRLTKTTSRLISPIKTYSVSAVSRPSYSSLRAPLEGFYSLRSGLSRSGSRSLSLQRRGAVTALPRASLAIKEPATGIEFPLVQKFWLGEECRALGASVRAKKIAFIAVKVYAVALYVEAELAAKELGVRDRGGFFENDDDFCSALVDGGFHKVLQIQLARDIEGAQFVEALEESLRPRLSLSGDISSLEEFSKFFQSKKLTKGTSIWLMYRTDATLDVVLRPTSEENLSEIVADLSIASASLCRALFEVYLGSNSVVPEGRKEWANGARSLLESDKIRRQTRKGGTG